MHQLPDVFINALKNKSEKMRAKAASDLQRYIATELQDESEVEQAAFIDDLYHQMYELVMSSDSNDNKGGIAAIASLTDMEVGNTVRSSRFANYLRNLLPTNDTTVMELAARAVGKLAEQGGSFTAEYVEFEVKKAIESIIDQEKNDLKKYAAVLVLKELADAAPTFFYQHVPNFFDNAILAVRDSKQMIREGAVDALRSCLTLQATRDEGRERLEEDINDWQNDSTGHIWYKRLFENAEELLIEAKTDKPLSLREEKVHGGLLILNELVRTGSVRGERLRLKMEKSMEHHVVSKALSRGNRKPYTLTHRGTPKRESVMVESRKCNKYIKECFGELCVWVLSYSQSRSGIVHFIVLEMLPRLAAFNPKLFCDNYLDQTMEYFLSAAKPGKDRPSVFKAIGLTALAVGETINQYKKSIMDKIKACLLYMKDQNLKKGKQLIVDPSIFMCVSMLGRAVCHQVGESPQEFSAIYRLMLEFDLSPSLTISLRELIETFPKLKSDVHKCVVNKISHTLTGGPYFHPGNTFHNPMPVLQTVMDSGDQNNIVLALNTLGSFTFESAYLFSFIKICSSCLNSDNKEVRMEAAKTYCKLLHPALFYLSKESGHTSSTMQLVTEVLTKMLVVGIADTEPDIRYCVLSSLDERFDAHLAQAKNLASLFMALHDEVFEIRELAVCIVGRLSAYNPAYVLPSLRKLLIQILIEMEHSGLSRNREQSSRLLGHLIASAPKLVRPYTEPIMRALVPKLKAEVNNEVQISMLAAVGEQALVSGSEMRKWAEELLPFIISILQQQCTLSKKEVALWTLGQLVENTGYVMAPYMQNGNLMDTLLLVLKTEQYPSLRREAISVLGILGALDPFKHTPLHEGVEQEVWAQVSIGILPSDEPDEQSNYNQLLLYITQGSLDDFYMAIALTTLMKMIVKSSRTLMSLVVQAVMGIIRTVGVRCIAFLPQVAPGYLQQVHDCHPTGREFLIQNLGVIVSLLKVHMRPYMPDIIKVIIKYWYSEVETQSMQKTLISLIEQIAVNIKGDFKVYLPDLMPIVLKVLCHDSSKERTMTVKMLRTIKLFGPNLEEYLHLVLPPVVVLFESQDPCIGIDVRREALNTIRAFTYHIDLTLYASTLVHPIVRTIDQNPDLRQDALLTLCDLIEQLGKKFKVFVSMVNKVITKHKIVNMAYDMLISRICHGTSMRDEETRTFLLPRHSMSGELDEPTHTPAQDMAAPVQLSVNVNYLQHIWESSSQIIRDDWSEWVRKLGVEFLKESPSPALRSCCPLAQAHKDVNVALFNSAFVACWSHLNEQQQDQLSIILKKALRDLEHPEITQVLLSLTEFMEHCDKGPLPIENMELSKQACRCKSFAKALHYYELEFSMNLKAEGKVSSKVLEQLIYVNNKLQLPEAAQGALSYAKREQGMSFQDSWYETLNAHSKALEAYRYKYEDNPNDTELFKGQMRCLDALGKWEDIDLLAKSKWSSLDFKVQQEVAWRAAFAAWGLGKWQNMQQYMNVIKKGSYQSSFLQAVVAIHHDEYPEGQLHIDRARTSLDKEMLASVGESYTRAYKTLVSAQMLSELEEVIQYKLVPDRRESIKQMWWERILGNRQTTEDWQRILQVRNLVVTPKDDPRPYVKYAQLCRRSNNLELSKKILVNLIGSPPEAHLFTAPYSLSYAYLKHRWDEKPKCEDRATTYRNLRELVESVEPDYKKMEAKIKDRERLRNQSPIINPLNVRLETEAQAVHTELGGLLSRGYFKLGQWMQQKEGITVTNYLTLDSYYRKASVYDRKLYKAWHTWARVGWESILTLKRHHKGSQVGGPKSPNISGHSDADHSCLLSRYPDEGLFSPGQPLNGDTDQVDQGENDELVQFAASSVKGYCMAISLSSVNTLQNILRLLTIWFEYGQTQLVSEAVQEAIKMLGVDVWLQVIPQIIARLDNHKPMVVRLICSLLMEVGKYHPQSLVYPLCVASKSSDDLRIPVLISASEKARELPRIRAANRILSSMCEHSNQLVQQARMISEELIRIAILWHELWHEGLEEASRLYFGEHNVQGMFRCLEPLHDMMDRGIQTMRETSFVQSYGTDLTQARDWCTRYKQSGNVKDLTQAWDLYYHVFRRVSKQLPQLTSLELQYVSPNLLHCRNLQLAVPGTYERNHDIIQISHMNSQLQVITSKQRPRKLSMFGSDGKEYIFLLKGHEDLRQDERVMQLFGLINTLLANDVVTCSKSLNCIQRFSVIPLSTNIGLIGWVPYCDTIHSLIREHRDRKKTLLNNEHRAMLKMAPDYDHLTRMQKVEVFEHAIATTPGDDIARSLWMRSPNSEIWFERRTNFVRSLAVMSIVGYILGLGDRHPSNLMMNRDNGRVLHIDFGDCFEVAMHREKFPEKIPFRLTRMLIEAMEVTGIDGNFRITCETVMKVLRQNKDSVLAVLEAFVYDPLHLWRLVDNNKEKGSRTGRPASTTVEIPIPEIPQQDPEKPKKAGQKPEVLNKKALAIIRRVRDKLEGHDFPKDGTGIGGPNPYLNRIETTDMTDSADMFSVRDDGVPSLNIEEQVSKLIGQATSDENLCQSYIGWCPFW